MQLKPTLSCEIPQDSATLSLAWSPNGEHIICGDTNGKIHLWHAQEKKLIQTIDAHIHIIPRQPNPIIAEIRSIAWHPNSSIFASGATDSIVRLWRLGENKHFKEHRSHKDWVYSVVFSPNGQTLASSGGDDRIFIWTIDKGSQKRRIDGAAKAAITCVDWRPDGQVLAAGNRNRVIRIYPMALDENIRMLRKHDQDITSVTFSKSGRFLASTSRDGIIQLWDGITYKLLKTLTAHQGRVYTAAFHPEENILVSGGEDGRIYFWDTDSGILQHTETAHSGMIRSIKWSPDGKEFVSAGYDKGLHFWTIN